MEYVFEDLVAGFLDNHFGVEERGKLLNANTIGKHFNDSSHWMNLLLNELGWIEKTVAGWGTTQLGRKLGGLKFEHETSRGTYVLWPEAILKKQDLLE